MWSIGTRHDVPSGWSHRSNETRGVGDVASTMSASITNVRMDPVRGMMIVENHYANDL